MNPTELQTKAIKAISTWFKTSKKQYFKLFGYAGTGKSTIIKYIIDECGLDQYNSQNVLYASYTGKSCDVMRKKGLVNVSTIHSLIYTPSVDEKTGIVKFILNRASPLKQTKLLVLDEVSMVNEDLALDLLSFGIKILVLGDPGQLPPISGEGFFTTGEPDFFLDEVHRQALESPIIALATMIREGGGIPEDGNYDGVLNIQHFNNYDFESLFDYDQIITGMNKTRRVINNVFKEHYNLTTYPDKKDLKLIILKNNKDFGIFNGMMVKSLTGIKGLTDKKMRFTQSIITDSGVKLKDVDFSTVPYDEYNQKIDMTPRVNKLTNKLISADYGYCISVHKSQGDQYDSLLFLDDGLFMWDAPLRKKLLYTAVTRAVEKLTFIKGVG